MTEYLIRQESDGTYAVAKPTTWSVRVLADSLSFDEAVEYVGTLGYDAPVSLVLRSQRGVTMFWTHEEATA